jgi:hypoxanthine-guanine phosphoribosyltransferase
MPNRPNIRMVLSAIDLKWNVAAIAAKIAADHKDNQDDPIVLLIVLNGAFMFGADLARALDARNVSCVIDLLSAASYKARKSSGRYRYFKLPQTNLTGRRIR